MSQIISYRSGAGNISDLQGYMLAGVPVGLPCVRVNGTKLSFLPSHVEREIICYSLTTQRVFIDSGAFSIFQANVKTGGNLVLDFDKIMRRYQFYAFFGNFSLVMPDCIGDQEKTFELQHHYRYAIQELIANGADVLMPIQKGSKSPAECWRTIKEILETDKVRIAIPSNKEAFSNSDIEGLLTCPNPPRKIHLLGLTHANSHFVARLSFIKGLQDNIEISCDGNRLRAMLGEGRKVTESQRELSGAIQESIREYSHVDDGQKTDHWLDIQNRLAGSLTGDQVEKIANALFLYNFDKEDLFTAAEQGELVEWIEDLPGFGDLPEDDLYKLVMSWESRDSISGHVCNERLGENLDRFFPNGYTFCKEPKGVARMIAVMQHADEDIPNIPVQRSMMGMFRKAA